SSNLQFFVASQTPAAPVPSFPLDGAAGIGLTPVFSWAVSPNTNYSLEVATDPAFNSIIESATNLTTGNYTSMVQLTAQSTYYWRVRGENICGLGQWPGTASTFTTGTVTCAPVISANVPQTITTQGGTFVTSTLTVSASGLVDDLNLTGLNIQHTWVGDLRVELTSPSGTTVQVFSSPADGDCSQNDVLVSFDDEATATYTDFDQMCSTTPPAIQGSFQPLEALSAFNGEPIFGTWTLTVYDDEDQDGGTLVAWGLDLCSTIPDDLSVTPSSTSVESCLGENAIFLVTLGTAFDEAGGVALSTANLPAGATAIFATNPAQPGSQVEVLVYGASTAGSYSFEVEATDGLGNNGSTTIQWTVNGVPNSPTTIAPAPGATGVSTLPVLSWSDNADTYIIRVATDPGMTALVFQGNSLQASAAVAGLAPCTEYFWTIEAKNDCGSSQPTAPISFTTVEDLQFTAPPTVTACPTANPSLTLNIGDCFESGGVTLAATGLPTGATFSFPQNPAPAGSDQALVLNLSNVAPGNYTVTITGADGNNNVTETFALIVNSLAAAPVFVAPANGATSVNPMTLFDWNSVPGATNYKLDVATDLNFNNIAFTVTVPQTNYTPSLPLAINTTYYWRVTAFNICGGTTPAAFSFTTWIVNSVDELNGLTINVLPNPASDVVNVLFSKPSFENMDASLYAVNGVMLKNQPVPVGSLSAQLDLTALPSGVYLLRLRSGSGVLTKKIVVEK
ncbi:MAG: proprotein convertase P-domain-containing protein, partial [Saprospiraceae bacterium]|nr:proprotein convertase P-domain-containing protein [Saprospiraceae bacterium]